MAFGPETYSRSAPTRYAEIEWGWYYLGDDQVTIYWDTDVYFGSVVLLNPYRSFTSGDTFPGSDGNNYQIGTYQEQDGPYYYYTPTFSTTTYAAGYEYYSIKQEVLAQPDLPTVNITSVDDTTPNENTSDQVTATTTTDSSATISSYAWSSSGGITFSSTTVQSPTITFPDVSVNTAASITCVVTDSLGATASDTQNYTIQAVPSYNLTGPTSVNEGSPASMTVTTTSVANNTTLYWTTSSDFNPNSGTVVISSNSGSFNVTPIADSTSEGNETHIVYLRTGSTSGVIVSQTTIEVIDTSINSGSGSGQGGGTAAYGVEIYDANSVKVLSVGDVLGFIVGSTTVDIARNSSTGIIDVPFPGLKTTDIPFVDSGAFPTHNLSLSIPAANTMRVQYFLANPPIPGTVTYELLAINLGD